MTALAYLDYPRQGALVRGDQWRIPVDILHNGTPLDVTGWTWHAQIRRHPDAELLDTFDTATGLTPPDAPDIACRVLLTLPPERTRPIPDGAVMDLEQLTPIQRTWWAATLRTTPDVSY